jgi:hypothetical protein
MSIATQTDYLPTVTPEIVAFAADHKVAAYLQPMLQMTSQVFQGRPMTVSLDEDPDIADDQHIIIDVDVTGLSAEQMFERQQHWLKLSFEHCPATEICVFRLGMMDRA